LAIETSFKFKPVKGSPSSMRPHTISDDTLAALGAGPTGLLSIRRPDDRGVIRVWGWGTWSPSYVDAHFVELGRMIEEVRALGLPVRVLVNLQKSAHQPPEVIVRIRAGSELIYREGDRIALVVESSLVKAQMTQLLDRSRLSFFISETAAALWLAPDLGWQRDADGWRA
jgi:hypothetical protein